MLTKNNHAQQKVVTTVPKPFKWSRYRWIEAPFRAQAPLMVAAIS